MTEMKDLRFKRKFSASAGNKAATVTIPRAIAQAWEQYKSVDLLFDGDCLVITPSDKVECYESQSEKEMLRHEVDKAKEIEAERCNI